MVIPLLANHDLTPMLIQGRQHTKAKGRQDLSKRHQRYDFDVMPNINQFHDNELFKGA